MPCSQLLLLLLDQWLSVAQWACRVWPREPYTGPQNSAVVSAKLPTPSKTWFFFSEGVMLVTEQNLESRLGLFGCLTVDENLVYTQGCRPSSHCFRQGPMWVWLTQAFPRGVPSHRLVGRQEGN